MSVYVVRKAVQTDAPEVDALLSEWLEWRPKSRLTSVRRAIRNGEIFVARRGSRLIGFIHYVLHEDIIDGGLNGFITAFYVSPDQRSIGVGSRLLERAISDSISRGAVEVEVSAAHVRAKRLYERRHFEQNFGDMGEVFLELDAKQYLESKQKSTARDVK